MNYVLQMDDQSRESAVLELLVSKGYSMALHIQ